MSTTLPDKVPAGRWLLRRWHDADAPALAAAVQASHRELGPWMPWCHAGYDETDALAFFAHCHAGAEAGLAFEYGIFEVEGGRCVGATGLNAVRPGLRRANLGYWVRSPECRQGIASTAAHTIAALGFQHLALLRIEIIVAVGNTASAAVARKVRAGFEGVARNALLIDGRPLDAQVFALVPGDLPGTAVRCGV